MALEDRARGCINTAKVEPVVRKILADVRKGGDGALRRYAAKFDGLLGRGFAAGLAGGDEGGVGGDSAGVAGRRSRWRRRTSVHLLRRKDLRSGRSRRWRVCQTGQIVRALGSVGCYVPGGRYPLPSDAADDGDSGAGGGGEADCGVLAEARARDDRGGVAGGRDGVLPRGRGAGNVAALAYGTETIARVDKIVGPGNLYVTAAKQMVSGECGIDMPAGPTEIVRDERDWGCGGDCGGS